MHRMHVRIAFALALLVIAGMTPANAAELLEIPSVDMRVTPLVIYDYQPGVTMRAYWLAPWRHHRYFPWTGKKPKLGRFEYFSVGTGHAAVPAESFYRVWSTSPAFVNEERE
jgi:hypothetical protein